MELDQTELTSDHEDFEDEISFMPSAEQESCSKCKAKCTGVDWYCVRLVVAIICIGIMLLPAQITHLATHGLVSATAFFVGGVFGCIGCFFFASVFDGRVRVTMIVLGAVLLVICGAVFGLELSLLLE